MPRQKATLIKKEVGLPTSTARLFIAAKIPDETKVVLNEKLKPYAMYTRRVVEPSNWHVTFLFLGRIENYQRYIEIITRDLSQAFLPAITLTHIGRGRQEGQLWAYAKPTALLQTIRRQLQKQLSEGVPGIEPAQQEESFIPHIKLAELRERTVSKFMADSPLVAVWPIRELLLFQSEVNYSGSRYEVVGKINL